MSAEVDRILNSEFPGGGGADFLRAHADMETEDQEPHVHIPLTERSEAELRCICLHDPDAKERREALDLLLAIRVAETLQRLSNSSDRAERDDIFRAA